MALGTDDAQKTTMITVNEDAQHTNTPISLNPTTNSKEKPVDWAQKIDHGEIERVVGSRVYAEQGWKW